MIRSNPANATTIDTLRKLPDDLLESVKLAVMHGGQMLAKEAISKAPKGLSTLTTSILSGMTGDLRAEVSAGVNYALAVHEGLKPGYLPNSAVTALEKWIRIKGIEPVNPKDTRRDLAWMIKRSIEKKGTTAQPFMEDAAQAVGGEIKAAINSEINKVLSAAGAG